MLVILSRYASTVVVFCHCHCYLMCHVVVVVPCGTVVGSGVVVVQYV